YGYNYQVGGYATAAADSCSAQRVNIVEGNCTSWGNPMSETYFESLRYFAGNSPTPVFTYADAGGSKDNLLGLPLATWSDPLTNNNYCAPLNVLVFNSSVSSSDDDLRDTVASAINSTFTAGDLTNSLSTSEGINSTPNAADVKNKYFFG